MIRIPGAIPIAIHPLFWLIAALIGWANSQSLIGMVIWIGIIFVSVLVHEFGHALTAVCFGQKAQIQLVALGGLTSYDGPKLKFWKQFVIVFNGPLAGMGLVILSALLLQLSFSGMLRGLLTVFMLANLFWSVVNLLPVLPLDGGQLLRIALEGFFGIKGFRASLLIGAILAALFSFFFFILQQFLIGAILFLFAFQSFDNWRKSRLANPRDREDDFRKQVIQGEELLQKGDKAGAILLFEDVLKKAPGGVLAASAAQYLGFLYADLGKKEEAYQLLYPIKKHLEGESLTLLHALAAERGNDELVAELSAECYQFAPNQSVAMRNAKAFARLGKPEPAGGWIQTAWQHGSFDLQGLLQDEAFAGVRENPQFREFVDALKQ